MEASGYLTESAYIYLLWALGISVIFISDYFPILSTVFTLGLPIEKRPDDSILLTEFIFIGMLLNDYYLPKSSSSYSSPLKASEKIGWLEFLDG
jgi:hypothetical protein